MIVYIEALDGDIEMKALVLAAGFPQIELIKEIKKRNITVLLADYNVEPVAKPYADKYFQVSTLDVDAIEKLARDEAVDFLITVCTDQALLTVALVSERLGLPCYIDYKTALNVTNKEYMKEVFATHNISTAKHIIVHEYNEKVLVNFEYPLIVKPVDCNSSKGVRKVQNVDELKSAITQAVKFSRTDTAIVEEFIEGDEISVDAYVEAGKVHILSVSNSEKIIDKDRFIIFRGNYPALDLDNINVQIDITVQQIADAFGLKNTPMLVQMINRNGRVYVLEFSARTGGGVKYLMIKKASGFDVIKAVVDLTLGDKPHVLDMVCESKIVSNEFVYCENGVFDHLEGFEELKNEGIISDYYLFKWFGAQLGEIQSSGDRICGFTIQGNSAVEMIVKHRKAINNIKIIDIKGRNIIRKDLIEPISSTWKD